MNGAVANTFVRHGWRCFRHNRHGAYLLDAATGYLGRAPEQVVACALSVPVNGGIDLKRKNAAWAALASQRESDSHLELQLALLGGRILVRFAHKRCRDEVARYFSCSHDRSGTSPDVIVECDWVRGDRHLFRARPVDQEGLPLEGVRVWPAGEEHPREWLSAQPPLPPLPEAPFKDRYIALHAATLRRPDGGGITIVGVRNSGKTSSALHLGLREGFEFLADETTFIHLRTAVAEPFPQSVGIWRDDGRKDPIPAAEIFPRVGYRPVLIDKLAVLTLDMETSALVEDLTPADAFQCLLPHTRDASASLEEEIVTLDHVARSVKAVRIRYHDRTDLPQLLDEVVSRVGAE